MEGETETAVEITNKTNSFLVNSDQLRELAQGICYHLSTDHCDLNVIFVDDDEMQSINHQTRGKDLPTDVLSFPQIEWQRPLDFQSRPVNISQKLDTLPPEVNFPHSHLGDIVIAPNKALENAEDINQGLDREVCFLLVHGILHLCGHDHIEQEEEQLMLSEQRKIMSWIEQTKTSWVNCVRVKS